MAAGALPEEDAAEMHFHLAGMIIRGFAIYSTGKYMPANDF